ncbi:hypothetical protein SMC26_17625 [Actinomadura fulvescens]
MSERQVEKLSALLVSIKTENRDLDDWDLTLTCDHVVRCTQHRDHDHYSRRVVDCPTCATRRGVVEVERVGPTDDPEGRVQRERLLSELQAAKAKLERQRRTVEKTQRRIDELSEKLRAAES